MQRVLASLAVLGLATCIGLPQVDAGSPKQTKQGKQSAAKHKEKVGAKQTYLGLAVESVPPAVASQVSKVVPKGQGVLVAQVAEHSPAAKAGLQRHDILLSFGKQKLHSPDELVKLVRGDKPGQEVTIRYARDGKVATCKVKLAQRVASATQERPHVFRLRPEERFEEMFEEFQSGRNGKAWESFESLNLKRLKGKRWHAEIEYRNKEGKKEHKTFEGTRAELRKAIHAEKDMPVQERNHLLRALNLHSPIFQFNFPSLDSLEQEFRNDP